MIDLAILSSAGARLPLPTNRARGVQFSSGRNGFQDLTFFLPLSDAAALALVSLSGLRAIVTEGGGALWEGRVEDLRLVNGGVQVAALGDWRALDDDLYTALWSASGVDRWIVLSNGNVPGGASLAPEMYNFQVDERIQISTIKNNTYANGSNLGMIGYAVPSQSTRAIAGIQFRVRLLLPNNWTFRIVRANADFTSQNVIATLTATGVLLDRAYHLTFTGQDVVFFQIFNSTGGVSTPAGETGANYAIISDIRLVTTVANRVDATLTANRAAGAAVTATVDSTAGMYAGMQLVMNSGNNPSEVITVTSVTSATQFVATFAGSYVIGNSVRGFKVTADEVARHIRNQLNTLNPGALSTSDRLITSPGLDLLNALYQDDSPQDVLAGLAEQGDTSGQKYEVGVWGNRELFFRPAGSGGQAWAVDAGEMEIEQTLDGLVNSTYGTYEDAGGRTLRTANQTSPTSISRYGRTRRRRVDVKTTSATLAALVAATATAATATPVPRSKITVRRFATVQGAPVAGYRVRAGDTVSVRNLTPAGGEAIDRVRTFRVAETQYSVDDDQPEITPETPTPDLDFQVAFTLRRARAGQ